MELVYDKSSTTPVPSTIALVRFFHFWARVVPNPPRVLLLLSGFFISGRDLYQSRPKCYYSCQVFSFLGESSTNLAQSATTLVRFFHFWARVVPIPPKVPLHLSGFGNSNNIKCNQYLPQAKKPQSSQLQRS